MSPEPLCFHEHFELRFHIKLVVFSTDSEPGAIYTIYLFYISILKIIIQICFNILTLVPSWFNMYAIIRYKSPFMRKVYNDNLPKNALWLQIIYLHLKTIVHSITYYHWNISSFCRRGHHGDSIRKADLLQINLKGSYGLF